MIEVKDEILTDEPRYVIRNSSGQVIEEDVTIEMTTPVVQEGTPLNKALFDSINEDFETNIPRGLICMWSGSNVPQGWHLCDGQEGTPDLRNRFIVGAGSNYNVGNTGGTDAVSLKVEELASHRHVTAFTEYSGGSGNTSQNMQNANYITAVGSGGSVYMYGQKVAGDNDGTVITTNTGSGTPHENRPPYYALAFIMKL